MEERNKHINQKPDGNYPKPDVPAGDAWAKMKDMLDIEMPSNAPSTAANTSWVKALKLILPFMTAVGCVYLVYKINNKDTSQKTQATTSFNLSNAEKEIDSTKKDFENTIPEKENSDENVTNLTIDNDSLKTGFPDTESKTKVTVLSNSIDLASEQDSGNIAKLRKFENKSGKQTADKPSPFQSEPQISLVRRSEGDLNDDATNANNSAKKSRSNRDLARNNKITTLDQIRQPDRKDRSSVQSAQRNVRRNPASNANAPLVASVETERNISAGKAMNLKMLGNRTAHKTSLLKQKFESIPIKGPVAKPNRDQAGQKHDTKALLNGLHVGLQWNTNLPLRGYDRFFTATNQSGSFYNLLIPGIWIGKVLNNGNMLMLKVNPYNQYFGNVQKIDSSGTVRTDSIGNRIGRIENINLLKTSGMSAGLQYVQQINKEWSVGLGTQIYWQKKALLDIQTINARDGKILGDSLLRIGRTSDNRNLMQPYFITGNLEVLYSWKKLQFGAAVMIPLTSLIRNAEQKPKPLNGQLLIRWKIK